MTHFDHLLRHVPDLVTRRVLDLGAGKGDFLLDAAAHGASVVGIELNAAYIEEARTKARAAGVTAEIVRGKGETLPFPDGAFDFVNLSEVIEHVEDPVQVLRETGRVLAPGGAAYVSVPSRFGLRDPHYHLYFVNWMPRAWSDGFIRVFGREKRNSSEAGYQRLSEMHYYTYNAFARIARAASFTEVIDIREKRIFDELPVGMRQIVRAMYLCFARPFYLDSSHVLLRK